MLTRLSAMRVGHAYNMDGPMVLRHIYAYADSVVDNNNWQNWRSILVCGERNGGRYYFALDVTDPSGLVDPLVLRRPYPWPMWEVGPTTAGLADMGYTWSTPSIWKMKILRGGNPHRPDTCWVAVVGGGFDCADLTKGRFIAVLDAFSGEVIRRLDLGAGAGPVAGPVTLADFDKNGTVDHLYVGDLNGRVWRFDVSDSVVANWQLRPNVAFFADPNSRPIYGGITLGSSGLDSTWLFFGTGDRDNPFSQLNNRFYGIRDIMDNNPVAIGNLDDVTGGGNCTHSMGWYKRVSSASDTSAIFSMPITAKFSDSVFTMGWKAPSGNAPACSSGAAGSTYLYSFFKTCGNNTAYRRFIAAGMPPGEFPHGIDKRGRHKGVAIRQMVHLETYLIGKIVKSWREVY
jgi:Tfp pilus tip-associated adhesin PilY1